MSNTIPKKNEYHWSIVKFQMDKQLCYGKDGEMRCAFTESVQIIADFPYQ